MFHKIQCFKKPLFTFSLEFLTEIIDIISFFDLKQIILTTQIP